MKMSYDPDDDILVIEFNKDRIVRDISLNWNVNVGMTEQGIGEIVILDAKKDGLLPLEIGEELRAAYPISIRRRVAECWSLFGGVPTWERGSDHAGQNADRAPSPGLRGIGISGPRENRITARVNFRLS